MRQILITKANGVMEPFDVSKLEHSLRRSGATADQIEIVVQKIVRKIKPNFRNDIIGIHHISKHKNQAVIDIFKNKIK